MTITAGTKLTGLAILWGRVGAGHGWSRVDAVIRIM